MSVYSSSKQRAEALLKLFALYYNHLRSELKLSRRAKSQEGIKTLNLPS
jgi:hypothetical protein